MTRSVVINVGKAFSRYPFGRYEKDGSGSGEEFRERLLLPHIRDGVSSVTIELDDAVGYGSSFLDEAFGGLVRNGIDAKRVLALFKFVSEDLSLIDEIKAYISEAAAHGQQ